MTETWTAPAAERTQPKNIASERDSLEQWLDFHRATLLQKCAGLSAEQLTTRSVPPSSISLIGLVRHMTDVERWWFRIHVAGEAVTNTHWTEQSPDGDFDDISVDQVEADLAAFHQEIEAARKAAAGQELDFVVPARGHHPERRFDVRWIYVHMIEEYARHNGHADFLRECIDGAVGD